MSEQHERLPDITSVEHDLFRQLEQIINCHDVITGPYCTSQGFRDMNIMLRDGHDNFVRLLRKVIDERIAKQ